jgi:hypothetical protein
MTSEAPAYDTSIDAYSFGIVLFEVAARELPFKEVGSWDISPAVAAGQRPKLPEGTGCPPELCRLMRRCWRQDPLGRPSFAEIRKELEVIGRGLGEVGPENGGTGASNSDRGGKPKHSD